MTRLWAPLISHEGSGLARNVELPLAGRTGGATAGLPIGGGLAAWAVWPSVAEYGGVRVISSGWTCPDGPAVRGSW